MRDIKRIGKFLGQFMKLWYMFPDWRFGQLVVNIFGRDPFYIEDDKALEMIEYQIKEYEENS